MPPCRRIEWLALRTASRRTEELMRNLPDYDNPPVVETAIGVEFASLERWEVPNTAPDLPPVPGRHPTVARDHEYQRLGTCSILAGLDLLNGHVTARVERRHRSREFIALLQDLDHYYAPDWTIRLILDNHSAHLSKETQAFLATRPNRFKYVLTPTHGSWLNIVETLFGKMARTFLRHIRVQSWDELRRRILQGIAEINAEPVVHRWQKFDALTTSNEAIV